MHLLYSKLEEYISDFLIENSVNGKLENDHANEIISRFLDTFETDKSGEQVLSFLEKLVSIDFFGDLIDRFFYHLVLGAYIPNISDEDIDEYKTIRNKNLGSSFKFALKLIRERSSNNVKVAY